jgi:hypothetical protein
MQKGLEALVGWIRRYPAAAVAIVVVVAALVAMPPILTSASPGYFGRYHSLAKNAQALEASSHSGIGCRECHTGTRGKVVDSFAVIGDFYMGLVKAPRSPIFVAFNRPANEACMKCHETDWSTDSKRTQRIPHPAHLTVSGETRECVKCHKWTAHRETYMKKHKEMPFSGVCVAYGCHVGWKTKDDCSTCHHVLYRTEEEWKKAHPQVVWSYGDSGCLEKCHEPDQCRLCHTTGKKPEIRGVVTEAGLKTIERLHVRPDWIDTHGAEALKDQSRCMRCHISTGECQNCHARRPAFHGSTRSWIGTHKDVAKKVDDPRCLTCHKKKVCDDCHAQFKEMQ